LCKQKTLKGAVEPNKCKTTPIMSRQSHYLCLSVAPVNAAQLTSGTDIDVLTIRKALQDALAELFGITAAGTYMDILAVTKPNASPTDAVGERRALVWGEVVLRIHPSSVCFFSFPLS